MGPDDLLSARLAAFANELQLRPPVAIVQRRLFALKDRNHISINTLMLLGARATLRRLENRLSENSFPFPTNSLELLGLVVATSFAAPRLGVP